MTGTRAGAPSQRDVAVLFPGVGIALGFKSTKSGDDAGAGLGRFDDRVNVTALGGHKGVGESVAEFGDFLLAKFFAFRFRRSIEFTLVDDIHRAFRTHDGNLRTGPGRVGVGSYVL